MDSSVINHIALNCRNLAAQEAFFSKHFGFQRSRTFKAGRPDEFIMLKLGSVRLELFPTGSTQAEHVNGGEQVIGFKHLAFDVPKLEPARSSSQPLRRCGPTASNPIPSSTRITSFPGFESCFSVIAKGTSSS
jgi:catechol 2,3-dioxygenase-like lactoylglutathione lyase family enzyme